MTTKKTAAPKKRRAPAHHVDKLNDPVGGQTVSGEADPSTLNADPIPGEVPAEPPPIPGIPVSEGLDPNTPSTAN